jgi:hypothetical protein
VRDWRRKSSGLLGQKKHIRVLQSVKIKTEHYSGDTKMTSTKTTWRTHHDHKDSEVAMDKDFQEQGRRVTTLQKAKLKYQIQMLRTEHANR